VGCVVNMSLLTAFASPFASRMSAIGGVYSVSARNFGRRKEYGFEKGHDTKNEVRKEQFWRKRNPPRKPWSDWRSKKNLHPQVLSWGPVSHTPDWSFAETGDAGVLNDKQARMRKEDIRLVKEVHQAAMLVLKAKQFEQSEK